jgi:hypothetical protein
LRDLKTDRDAAPGQREHQDIGAMGIGGKLLGELLPSIGTVSE